MPEWIVPSTTETGTGITGLIVDAATDGWFEEEVEAH